MLRKFAKYSIYTALVTFVVFFCLYQFYFLNKFDFEVVHYEVQEPENSNLNGLRIVFFSDLHVIDSAQGIYEIKKVISAINSQKPDLVLFGGDLVNTDAVEVQMPPSRALLQLRNIHAKYGVYAVLGNHDWQYGGDSIMRLMSQTGIQVLENRSVVIDNRLNLVGISDDNYMPKSDINKAFRDTQPQWPSLVLTHSPDPFAALPAQAFLSLAGHTHGGQIRIPGFRSLLLFLSNNKSDFFGRKEEDGKTLLVSKGIGTSWFRCRINCPSDILVITLK